MSRSLLEKVIRLCETRGFSMESCVEGSVGTTYTYQFGPLGTELRRNLRNSWWCDVVQSKANIYGFETTGEIIHTLNGQNGSSARSYVGNEHDKGNVISDLGKSEKPTNPIKWTSENANILTSLVRFIPGIQKPFGIARNRKYFGKPESDKYIFRSCVMEEMFLQFICAENRVNDWINHWKRQRLVWWRRFANTRSNYSLYEEQVDLEAGLTSQTTVQYAFPWGQETVDSMIVISDLHQHMDTKQCSELPFSEESKLHAIQIKTDLNRGFLSFLMDAYLEKERSNESGNVDVYTVLHLHPRLAPIKVAVVCQTPQQKEHCDVALQLSSELREAGITTHCLLQGSTNECYAYHDEIGTPYCVTIIDSTLSNGIVMFRSRNTTLQEFMHVSDVVSTVRKHLGLSP